MPSLKTPAEHLADLRAEPGSGGVVQNAIDDLKESDRVPQWAKDEFPGLRERARSNRPDEVRQAHARLAVILDQVATNNAIDDALGQGFPDAGGRRASQTKRFNRCVKAVRRTVKARKGSSKESAAIAICTKSILHPRGRTLKRYRKGRLLTQKRRR